MHEGRRPNATTRYGVRIGPVSMRGRSISHARCRSLIWAAISALERMQCLDSLTNGGLLPLAGGRAAGSGLVFGQFLPMNFRVSAQTLRE
jgi:hypothetical protein